MHNDIASPVSACSTAPSLHNATASTFSCTGLPRESPRLILARDAILNHPQPLFGCPSQYQKQTNTRAGEQGAQCCANISLPSRDTYDKENCLLSRYHLTLVRPGSPTPRRRRRSSGSLP